MTSITQNLQSVRNKINKATEACHRSFDEVKLLAVSKKQPASAIREAFLAGQQDFGENYLQEALEKMRTLNDLSIEWHFIGSIQSKKSVQISQNFSWVHTVERIKVANLLNQYRPVNRPPLNICIQVNIDNEDTKSGVSKDLCLDLANQICSLPRLNLRGIMAIPKTQNTFEMQYQSFKRLTDLKLELEQKLKMPLDTLSMGMSSDLTAAIHAGSTLVRIGEAIFGARQ